MANGLTRMLAAVATSVPDVVVIADRTGCVRFLNPAAERIFGRATRDLLGQHVSVFSAPGERERSYELTARLAAGEAVEPILMELEREDGSCFTAEITLSPLFEDGDVLGMVAIGRDVTARLRAEADAARLAAIVTAANEAILGIDANGTIQSFSPSAERVLGWRADEVIGRSAELLIAPRHRIGMPALSAALEARGSLQRETVVLRKDGTEAEVEVSVAPIRGTRGEITGAAIMLLDVSERRRTQRRLERIIEHAPVSVGVKGLDGRYELFNRRGAAEIGRTAKAIVGHTDSEVFGEEPARRILEQDRIVLETGEPQTFRLDFGGPEGLRSSYLSTRFPVPGPSGEIEALGMIAADVTELRRAEADQAQLAAIVHAAPDAIIARDRDGRVVTWNPGAEAMFGLPAEEAIGRPYAELVVPEEERERFEQLNAAAQAGTTAAVRVVRRRADGTRFPAQVSVAPLTLLDGSWHGTLALIRDISDAVAAEQELATRAEQLERSNAELERFAYAASHDLQEPLQSIKLSAGTVLATAADRLEPDERELVGLIDSSATRLSRQIHALMQLARVGLATEPGERVQLTVAVRDAIDALRSVMIAAEAEVVVHEPLPAVEVPRTEVALVLQNLLANAIKHRREDVPPHVEIAAAVGDRAVEVRVTDNGVGLSEADLERVFGLFERGATTAPGTGMGLAVARRMLAHQGGALTARSAGPGRGSEFTLRLPT